MTDCREVAGFNAIERARDDGVRRMVSSDGSLRKRNDVVDAWGGAELN